MADLNGVSSRQQGLPQLLFDLPQIGGLAHKSCMMNLTQSGKSILKVMTKI